jgi:hypothetical protein
MQYERWMGSVKALPWLTTLIGVGAILFDRNIAVVVVPSALGVFVATTMLVRSRLSIGLFLVLGWLSVACLLACASAMAIVLARHEGVLDTSRIGWMTLAAVFVLVAVARVYPSKVWELRLKSLKSEIAGPECTKVFFFSRWTGPSQIRFWSSPFALAAMSGVSILGAWLGYQYGDGLRAALVFGAISLAWIFLIGSGVAQLMHVRDYREIFSIRLI